MSEELTMPRLSDTMEEGRIGQAWRSDRWESFRLNTPRWMSRLQGQAVAAVAAGAA